MVSRLLVWMYQDFIVEVAPRFYKIHYFTVQIIIESNFTIEKIILYFLERFMPS